MKSPLYRLVAFNGRFIHSCLALFYVRAALEENLPACRTEIMQFTINEPYYPTLRRIGSGRPAALFFSVYIWNTVYIERLIVDLVRLLPHSPIILGGPQAETLAGELAPDVFARCTLVPGEIEGIDRSFYHDLTVQELKRSYACARGPGFANPYRPDDFAGPLSNRQIYYESSRGCPFGCTYCLSASETGVRHLPVAQVCREIKDILRFGPGVVRFVDRTFNDLPARALDIWRFLAEQPVKTLFHFELTPDRFTGEMFKFLQQVEAGRFQFELGIQSTNAQTLAAVNRKCDIAVTGGNIRRLVALGTIHIHLDLILGLPYEDKDSFLRSFQEVFTLGPHYIQMGLLKVLPGTPLSKMTETYGLVVCKRPPYEVMSTGWLTPEELEELFWFGACVETFYNNRFFRSFWEYLRRSGEAISVFFTALLGLCREKGLFDRAYTQELLSSFLLELCNGRPDSLLVKELLIFDWLRCGHHFLPAHFGQEPVANHRKRLWNQMPQNWEGVYDYSSRDEFFKQGVFAPFSEALLRETGVSAGTEPGYVCFGPAREAKVFEHASVLLLKGCRGAGSDT